MAMIGKIRRMYHRQKKSVREISRITSLSRNTIRKWLDAPLDGEPKPATGPAEQIGADHETLTKALKADARRSKEERRSALALFAEIRAAGYTGRYSRVTDFIRAWRQGEGTGTAVKAFVPLTFELGESFQFDWREEGLVVGGIYPLRHRTGSADRLRPARCQAGQVRSETCPSRLQPHPSSRRPSSDRVCGADT